MQRIKEELKKLEAENQYRKIPNIEAKSHSSIKVDDIEYINLASNDYLNISTNSSLKNKFLSTNTSLLSSASARLLTGSDPEYTQLEQTLADIFNKDKALIFNTGYQCNLGVITALNQKGDIVFSDKLNHASIIDGLKLSEGDFIRYKHLDYEHLESLLKTKRNSYNRALIVSESIFSMDGDIADIDKLIELKNKYNCLLMIDEAHAFGSFGEDLTGVSGQKDVDIITATFGKALGSFGAFCVSNSDIINYLINKSRSFIFSTAIPPINIAWTNWLLTEKRDFLLEQKEKLAVLTNKTLNLLKNTPSKSYIIPIIIGSNTDTITLSEKLKGEGYYIPAIRPPTVPEGKARLRISLTADIEFAKIERLIKLIREFLV